MVPLIRQDRANHLIYGALAFIIAAALACAFGWSDCRYIAGAAGSLAVGAYKEVSDYLANREAIADGFTPLHSVDPTDLAFTAAGGLLAAAAALVGAA